jgi:hypothetical protein
MNFIKTQDGELLNLAQIINLNIAKGEGVNEQNKVMLTMYGVIAMDILGKTHDLGFYDSVEQADNALDEVAGFIELGKMSVLDMPDYSEE